MKRNGRNLKMPHDKIVTSDQWSQLKNSQRYDYLNCKTDEDKRALLKHIEDLKK